MANKKRIETICVQGGYTPKNGEPRQIPIYQSTTFKYDTSEDMGKLFDLEASGYFYTRLQNPTNDLVAAKLCELEGGTAAMLRRQTFILSLTWQTVAITLYQVLLFMVERLIFLQSP